MEILTPQKYVIMISIHSKYVQKIFTGQKRYEYRRVIPTRLLRPIILLYETSPVSKIIGYIIYDKIIKAHPKHMWKLTQSESGITLKEFAKYFQNTNVSYAYHIIKVVQKEIPIDHIKNFSIPQNFIYMKYEKFQDLIAK